MNIEEIIINKIDEINEEYNVIVRNSPDNGYKLENINILAHQKEAMNKVLNELLTEVNNQPDYKTISQIAKMISSGEIPKEVYDKYLGDCPIGFMNYGDLLKYLTNNQPDYKSAFKKAKDRLEDLHSGYLSDEVVEFDDFEDLDLEEKYEINMNIESNPPKKIDVDYNKIINFQKGLTNGFSSMELIKVINKDLIEDGDTIFCRFEDDNEDIDNQLQRYVFDNGTILEELSNGESKEIGISMLLDGRTPLRWIYISK